MNSFHPNPSRAVSQRQSSLPEGVVRCGNAIGKLIVACLLAVLWQQPTVHAGCGDYLFRNGKPVSMDHHPASAGMPRADHQLQPASVLVIDERPVSEPVAPCHGPGCSAQKPIPLAPTPSKLVTSFSDAAFLTVAGRLFGLPSESMAPATSEGVAFYRAELLFRPPKPSQA
ncbi:MAG: hypothetical protein KDA91_16535 [Planctomycetaceae bacterium]|nr:hypothetical protein [Planctomycetaceae bacterium]